MPRYVRTRGVWLCIRRGCKGRQKRRGDLTAVRRMVAQTRLERNQDEKVKMMSVISEFSLWLW